MEGDRIWRRQNKKKEAAEPLNLVPKRPTSRRWWWPEARSGGWSLARFSHWLSRRGDGIVRCLPNAPGNQRERKIRREGIRPLNQPLRGKPVDQWDVQCEFLHQGVMGAAAGSEKPRILQLYTVKDRKGGYLLTRIFFSLLSFSFLTLDRSPKSSLDHELWGVFVSQCSAIKQPNNSALLGTVSSYPRPASKRL
jgi:hypothetical protein